MLKRGLGRLRNLLDEEIRRLASNTGWLAASSLGKIIVGMVQVGVVTRFLGVEKYGELVTISNVTVFITIIFAARVWEWVSKFFSEAYALHNRDMAGATLRLGLKVSGAINGTAAVVIWAVSHWVATNYLRQPGLTWPIRLFGLNLLFNWFNDPCTAAMRVFGQFRFMAIYGLMTSIVRMVCLVVPLMLGFGLYGILVGYIVVEATSGLFLYLKTARTYRTHFGSRWWEAPANSLGHRKQEIRHLLMMAFGVDTLRSLGSQLDVLVLAHWRGPLDVGYFKAAQNILEVVNRVAATIIQAVHPTLGRLVAEKNVRGILRLARRSTALMTIVVALGCLIGWFTAPYAIRLTAGRAFGGSVSILRVLIWSSVWMVVFWTTPLLMNMGKVRWVFEQLVLISVVKLAVMFALVGKLGAVGVALASTAYAVTYVGSSAIYFIRARTALREATPASASPAGAQAPT